MATYDLYGVEGDDLRQAKELVERLLKLNFEERESGYKAGTYYCFGSFGEENFELKLNLDSLDNEPAEQGYPEFKMLLYVNNTSRSMELQQTLSNVDNRVILLRREDFTDGIQE